MTPLKVSILGAIASFCLVLIVLELIRQRRLQERYALLWLLTGLTLTALAAWRSGLNTIAGWVGIRGYPPAVLFAVGILFILVVLLHYSTVISRLSVAAPIALGTLRPLTANAATVATVR